MRGLFALVLVCALWGGISADAKTLYILDFDGSVNNDHSDRPAWRTKWILFRVRDLRSLLQRTPEELEIPETIDISYGEYVRLRPYLAKGEAVLGDLRPQPLDEDPVWKNHPKTIVPGYFYIDPHHSFKFYRPGRKGKNYLLKDYQDAKKRHELLPDSDGYWGPAFPLLKKALSAPETVGDLVILTARHHLRRELREFLAALQADGEVAHIVGPKRAGARDEPRLVSMHAPEALAYGRGNVAVRKAQAVIELVRHFLETNDGSEHLELSADPSAAARGEHRPVHTVIVAEDTPANIEAIRKAVESLSSELGFQSRMKFVLLNTGREEVIQSSRWPYRWTVFHHGFGRPATESEIRGWTASDCEGALQ